MSSAKREIPRHRCGGDPKPPGTGLTSGLMSRERPRAPGEGETPSQTGEGKTFCPTAAGKPELWAGRKPVATRQRENFAPSDPAGNHGYVAERKPGAGRRRNPDHLRAWGEPRPDGIRASLSHPARVTLATGDPVPDRAAGSVTGSGS
jgi:hypothetical protein